MTDRENIKTQMQLLHQINSLNYQVIALRLENQAMAAALKVHLPNMYNDFANAFGEAFDTDPEIAEAKRMMDETQRELEEF